MRLALAAGVALAGLAFSAFAEETPRVDSNNDGWVTRAEAAAMAERAFRNLDNNSDGKLDAGDRRDDRRLERRTHRRSHDGDHDAHELHGRDGVAPRHGRPRLMMMAASREEADVNGDNALSLEEFRNQHLRFFDASDVNGDGRIRFDPPHRPEPRPPQPPQ
jgi:hypothetical protein